MLLEINIFSKIWRFINQILAGFLAIFRRNSPSAFAPTVAYSYSYLRAGPENSRNRNRNPEKVQGRGKKLNPTLTAPQFNA
jgi:hypothetical protein